MHSTNENYNSLNHSLIPESKSTAIQCKENQKLAINLISHTDHLVIYSNQENSQKKKNEVKFKLNQSLFECSDKQTIVSKNTSFYVEDINKAVNIKRSLYKNKSLIKKREMSEVLKKEKIKKKYLTKKDINTISKIYTNILGRDEKKIIMESIGEDSKKKKMNTDYDECLVDEEIYNNKSHKESIEDNLNKSIKEGKTKFIVPSFEPKKSDISSLEKVNSCFTIQLKPKTKNNSSISFTNSPSKIKHSPIFHKIDKIKEKIIRKEKIYQHSHLHPHRYNDGISNKLNYSNLIKEDTNEYNLMTNSNNNLGINYDKSNENIRKCDIPYKNHIRNIEKTRNNTINLNNKEFSKLHPKDRFLHEDKSNFNEKKNLSSKNILYEKKEKGKSVLADRQNKVIRKLMKDSIRRNISKSYCLSSYDLFENCPLNRKNNIKISKLEWDEFYEKNIKLREEKSKEEKERKIKESINEKMRKEDKENEEIKKFNIYKPERKVKEIFQRLSYNQKKVNISKGKESDCNQINKEKNKERKKKEYLNLELIDEMNMINMKKKINIVKNHNDIEANNKNVYNKYISISKVIKSKNKNLNVNKSKIYNKITLSSNNISNTHTNTYINNTNSYNKNMDSNSNTQCPNVVFNYVSNRKNFYLNGFN